MNERLDYLFKRAYHVINELYSIDELSNKSHVKATVSNILSRIRDYKAFYKDDDDIPTRSNFDLLENQIALAEDFIIKFRQNEGSKDNERTKDSHEKSQRISFDSIDGDKSKEIFGGF